jgi:3-deoxy-manno-octulosonate cytidylyltransferase (CMP-KDO synthetase)
MYKNKTIACVIPARLASTRFPRKILADLAGKSLVQHAYEAAQKTGMFDDIVIAIDAEETQIAVERFNGKAVMTSLYCSNGTQRLLEVMAQGQIKADIWVNWQADEPFIHRALLEDLLQGIKGKQDVWTLRKRIEKSHEIEDPNIVKVVVNANEEALYFSRCPIPYCRDRNKERSLYKHIGLYAYSSKALEKIANMPPCDIEETEMLEQLRFLYYGLKLQVFSTQYETIGIDLPEHLEFARQYI